MKEVVKDRVPVSMDALVQQTESPFTTGVLHFPLPTKFRMLQIEDFDGMKDHVDHLIESFQVLKDYKMKLNPTKCAFEVSEGKFLGFIVNSREIEANPDKIKVVLDMQPPSNTKEIQRLTRRIVALSRFVSRSSDKCQPFS